MEVGDLVQDFCLSRKLLSQFGGREDFVSHGEPHQEEHSDLTGETDKPGIVADLE